MRLEKYIYQLLFQHDCIVVPKLGAFISHPSSASINPEEHILYPPYKSIKFTSSILQNDGLLEKTYVAKENLNIDEARTILEADIKEWKNRLDKGESIFIDKIGALKKGEEIFFEPNTNQNLFAEKYGFKPLKPNLIIAQTTEIPVEENKRNWSSLLAAASIIPIIVGGYFYFNTPQNVQKFVDHQWSGIVLPVIKEAAPNLLNSNSAIAEPTADNVHPLPTTISDPLEYIKAGATISLPAEEYQDSLGNDVISKYEITVVEEKKINDKEKEVKAIIKNSTPEAKPKVETPEVKETKIEEVVKIDAKPKKYQIIASSLRRPEDAARMLKDLQTQGYKNASVVYVKGRYYYVNFDSFESLEKATKFMNELHAKRPDAWMREHK